MSRPAALSALACAALASACATAAPPEPADAFLASLKPLCGKSFEGRVVTDDPADDAFRNRRLLMTVGGCTADEVRIPFHVGEDRSRTWIVTRTGEGLRLKHDHRHADGSPDELTMYGGDTVAPGTAARQEFPADAFSKALFDRTGRSVSNANVWAMEVRPGETFAYELRRPNRFFRVEFDLSRPVER